MLASLRLPGKNFSRKCIRSCNLDCYYAWMRGFFSGGGEFCSGLPSRSEQLDRKMFTTAPDLSLSPRSVVAITCLLAYNLTGHLVPVPIPILFKIFSAALADIPFTAISTAFIVTYHHKATKVIKLIQLN